jgi:hypothetical protein
MSTRAAIAAVATVAAVAVGGFAYANTRDDGSGAGPAANAKAARTAAPALVARKFALPKGHSILTLVGVANGNSGATTTKLDYATVDRLADERVVVFEPFLKRNVTFTGIRMSKFIRLTGFPGSGKARLAMHAADDYHVSLLATGLAAHAFLATRANGKPMALAKGGPVRLVFLGTGTLADNTDNWIWSIDRIKAA